MSDPSLLRAAASRLRELAEQATPGPWRPELSPATAGEAADNTVYAGADGDYEHPVVTSGGYDGWFKGGCETPDDARFVAAMSPLVGLAVADWLDEQADKCAMLRVQPNGACLAVARAVMGGDTNA